MRSDWLYEGQIQLVCLWEYLIFFLLLFSLFEKFMFIRLLVSFFFLESQYGVNNNRKISSIIFGIKIVFVITHLKTNIGLSNRNIWHREASEEFSVTLKVKFFDSSVRKLEWTQQCKRNRWPFGRDYWLLRRLDELTLTSSTLIWIISWLVLG